MVFDNICRTCTKNSEELVPIFGDTKLPHKIKIISSVEISEDDNLPKNVCPECISNIDFLYNFQRVIINSDQELRERLIYLHDESDVGEDIDIPECSIKLMKYEDESEDSDDEESEFVNENEELIKTEIEIDELEDDSFSNNNDDEEDVNEANYGEEEDINEANYEDEEENVDEAEANYSNFDNDVDGEEQDVNEANYDDEEEDVNEANDNEEENVDESEANYSNFDNDVDGEEKDINKSKDNDSAQGIKLQKLYQCEKCEFETMERKRFTTHIACHKVQICNVCGKFITAINMKKHLVTHTDCPVTCEHCGKVFKNYGSLRGHLLIHKGINRTCRICGENFTVRSAFAKHWLKHKSREEKLAKCPLCDKKVDKSCLKRHIRSHTGEKPYACEFCNKGFSTEYALKTHRRQHTNEKPYKCALCLMGFPQKVSLRTHLRSKHQMMNIDGS